MSKTKTNMPYNVINDKKDYYIGFSITPTFVSYSVTNVEYNVLYKKDIRMEGVRSLDVVSDAKDRKIARSGRRSVNRKNQRKKMINDFFKDGLSVVDKEFLQRQKESGLHEEDKSVKGHFSLFNDDNYTDKEFNKEYHSIYHLRRHLMVAKEKQDLRLYKLAISHIINNRGHALYNSLNAKEIYSFDIIWDRINACLQTFLNFEITCIDKKEFVKTIQNASISLNEKKKRILKCCELNKAKDPFYGQKKEILNSIIGCKSCLSQIFDNESYKNDILNDFKFSDLTDEKMAEYSSLLESRFVIFQNIKSIYDWIVLSNILKGYKTVSEAKIAIYNQHGKDLSMLKNYVRQYCPENYALIFKNDTKPKNVNENINNYVAYTGHKRNKKTGKNQKKLCYGCSQIEFCQFLKKVLGPESMAKKYNDMFERITNYTFMPKINTPDNAVIPTQLHRIELVEILNNAKRDYPDIFDKTEADGLTIYEKILSLFDFRIPYYVGPLNSSSKFSWFVRKEKGKIYPWNFYDKVDIKASAQKFIEERINNCSLLPQYLVIPKCSILYSKYCVLNELNNVQVNESKLSVEEKQNIFNDLFLNQKNVTETGLKKYLISKGCCNLSKDTKLSDIKISGIKGQFNSSMLSYILLKDFGFSEEEMEYIIWINTIFAGAPEIIVDCINERFEKKIDKKTLEKISNMSFSGWSALSREVLTTIPGENTSGEKYDNIMDALWRTNDNLQILKGSKYTFGYEINKINHSDCKEEFRQIINNSQLPPAIRRAVFQACRQAKEIISVMERKPKKVFIKTLRFNGVKEDTLSRKAQLLRLYDKNKIKKDNPKLYSQLLGVSNSLLKRKKYYLYFMQLGKDLYTGEEIEFNDLAISDPNNENHYYDTDHIYPKSKVDDDSISLNLVLTLKKKNEDKDDVYPVDINIRKQMSSTWYNLMKQGFITAEKYNRLTRKTPLTEEEITDFVSSQIVDTNQTIKATSKVFKSIFKDTPIVYVKQELITAFRYKNDMMACKEINDISYAKDAYLAVVVGNVFDEIFTKNKRNFVKNILKNKDEKNKFSIQCVFNHNQKNSWVANNNKSLNIVYQEVMNEKDVLFTRCSFYGHGKLFDVNPHCINDKAQIPLKKTKPYDDINKYGGYNSAKIHHFTLVEVPKITKNKTVKEMKIVSVPLMYINEFKENPVQLLERMGYNNPEILVPYIKKGSRFEYDGLLFDLTGKTGSCNCVKIAKQLILSYEDRLYLKRLESYYSEINEIKNKKIVFLPDKKYAPDKVNNLRIYEILYNKMMTEYSVAYYTIGLKIQKATNKFNDLSVDDQVVVIHNILSIIKYGQPKSLELINLSKNSGGFSPSSNLKNRKSVIMYDSSVTGLFSKKRIII